MKIRLSLKRETCLLLLGKFGNSYFIPRARAREVFLTARGDFSRPRGRPRGCVRVRSVRGGLRNPPADPVKKTARK